MTEAIAEAPATPVAPSKSDQFMEWLEDLFDVRQGEARAYMELPQRDGTDERIVYRVIGFAGLQATEEQLYERLKWAMRQLHARFVEKVGADRRPLLYWRRKPSFTITSQFEFDDTVPAIDVAPSGKLISDFKPADGWAMDGWNTCRKVKTETPVGNLTFRLGIFMHTELITPDLGYTVDGYPALINTFS